MTRRALGLTGPAGAGKSTIARILVERIPAAETLHAGFALKAMLRAFYAAQGVPADVIEAKVEGAAKRAPCPFLCGKTPTEAQQTLGTEWGRNMIAPDLWLGAWQREAARRIAGGALVINDSIRFENEAAAIRALGGIVIRLGGRRDDRVAASHVSEAGVRADLVIDNSGPVGDTVAAILAAIC